MPVECLLMRKKLPLFLTFFWGSVMKVVGNPADRISYSATFCDSVRCFVISVLLLGVLSPALRAQSVREAMESNQKVFELVNAYVENANLTDRYPLKSGTFRNLFESQNTSIYMDHISWFNNSNREDTTTLQDYCSFYEHQQGSFTQFSISDVAISCVKSDNQKMIYTAELTKSYLTKNIDKPVVSRLVLHIQYSLDKKVAKITKIECMQADNRMRPHIMANYVKSSNTLYIPNTLKVKKIGGSETNLDSRVQPLSADIYKQLSERNCATYQYVFTPHNDTLRYHTISVNTVKNAVGLEIGYVLPLGARDMVIPSDADFTFGEVAYRRYTFRIGANYWRQIYATGRHRVSFETGLLFEFGSQRFKSDNYQDQYASTDADGDDYIRMTQLSQYSEVSRSLSLAIPAAIRYDYYVIPDLSVFVSAGVRGAMAFHNPVKASFDGYYAGLYGDEYFNMMMDQNGYYDFGTYHVTNLQENSPKTLNWHLDFLAKLGAQYFFTSDKRWSAEFSVGYRYRFLTAPKSQTDDFRLSLNSTTFSSVCGNLYAQPKQFLDFQLGAKYNF